MLNTVDFQRLAKSLKTYLLQNKINRLLLGLSGGPDSVLLYHLIRRISGEIPEFFLLVSHVNFNLRGEESIRDQNFVKSLISQYPLKSTDIFTINSFNTLEYCKENHLSVEMGARELRYNLWKNLMKEHRLDRIVTGHHADDNIETFFINLLRGSGIKGLKGMEYDTGLILRPLIHLNRGQILKHINDVKADYILDSTNFESDYQRNFIRNEVIPLLNKKWFNSPERILKTISILQEEGKIIDDSLSTVINTYPNSLPVEIIKKYPSPSTLIYRWINQFGGSPSMAKEIAQAIKDDKLKGQHWLPNNSQNRHLILTPTKLFFETEESLDNFLYQEEYIPEITSEIRNHILHCPLDEIYLPESIQNYYWRTPKKGDKIRLFTKGQSGNSTKFSKLVSDVLKEAKVPTEMRRNIQLL